MITVAPLHIQAAKEVQLVKKDRFVKEHVVSKDAGLKNFLKASVLLKSTQESLHQPTGKEDWYIIQAL